MDYQTTECDAYFAAIAESYDRLQPILSPPYSKGLEMIVDLIPFDPNVTFKSVERGCGTAEPTARVLERFPPGGLYCPIRPRGRGVPPVAGTTCPLNPS